MPTVPPNAPGRKRPWYLVVALLGAWLFGAAAMAEGWETIEFYRTSRLDAPSVIADIADDATRAAVMAQRDRVVAAMDASRSRLFPLSVAEFVLGITMWIVAGSAMTGRRGARNVLMQIVIAQTALIAVEYGWTREVRKRALDLALMVAEANHPVAGDAQQKEQVERITAAMIRVAPPFRLAGQVLARGLILVALTRPKTRQFFEATSSQASEQ